MNWQEVKDEFEWDGALRDLYVLDADIEMWQRVLELLRTGDYPLSCTVDNEAAELPDDCTAIFRKRLEVGITLSIDVYGIRINCHFFTEEQIEFDIDPREINNEDRFRHLCDFMQRIGKGLQRDVILTPETSDHEEQSVIIRYLPNSDQFHYTPLGIYH